MNTLFKSESFLKLLKKNWCELLDQVQLMRILFEHIRDTKFKKIKQDQIESLTKISVTDVEIQNDSLILSIEFTIPKADGVVIGTLLCSLKLNGEFKINSTFGTHFEN